MRISLTAAALLVVGGAAACKDDTCLMSEVAFEAVQDSVVSVDWRERLTGFVATAPADSVMELTVFLNPHGKQAFRDWAEEAGVEVYWEFKSFSGFAIRVRVSTLPGLLPQEAITGVFWGDTGMTYGQECG